jgi:hypothetical protein
MADMRSPSKSETPLHEVEESAIFEHRFTGRFIGMRRWSDYDRLAERLVRSPEGWYVYMIGREPPSAPADAVDLAEFVRSITDLIKSEHDEKYCGIVYVDDPEQPSMVKIYDPNHLGSSCGSGGERVLPGWVLSRWRPGRLDDGAVTPAGRLRWFARLFSRS